MSLLSKRIRLRAKEIIAADSPCAAAAVFTTNAVAAAPVVYDRAAVRSGRIQAIAANSGCANACTGEHGLRDAERSARFAAGGFWQILKDKKIIQFF